MVSCEASCKSKTKERKKYEEGLALNNGAEIVPFGCFSKIQEAGSTKEAETGRSRGPGWWYWLFWEGASARTICDFHIWPFSVFFFYFFLFYLFFYSTSTLFYIPLDICATMLARAPHDEVCRKASIAGLDPRSWDPHRELCYPCTQGLGPDRTCTALSFFDDCSRKWTSQHCDSQFAKVPFCLNFLFSVHLALFFIVGLFRDLFSSLQIVLFSRSRQSPSRSIHLGPGAIAKEPLFGGWQVSLWKKGTERDNCLLVKGREGPDVGPALSLLRGTRYYWGDSLLCPRQVYSLASLQVAWRRTEMTTT